MNRKRILSVAALAILACIVWVAPTAAQTADPIKATLAAHGENWTVGDPIQLTLAVTHPADHHVILPELGESWGELVIRSQSPATTITNDDGTKTTSQAIDVRLFAPGSFTTPPLSISLSDSAGGLTEVVAPPVSLTISSVLVEGDTELRDIKPQASLPFSNLLPWLAAGVLAALAAGGLFLWWNRKRRMAMELVDPRLPHEVAQDELDRIDRLGLAEKGRFKEHYTLVSDCIRIYMESAFDLPIMDRTTSEVRAYVGRTDVLPHVAKQFIYLLIECDLVKFSKYKPGVANARLIVEQARQIVEETKPAPVEAPGDETPDAPYTGVGLPPTNNHRRSEVTA